MDVWVKEMWKYTGILLLPKEMDTIVAISLRCDRARPSKIIQTAKETRGMNCFHTKDPNGQDRRWGVDGGSCDGLSEGN